MKSAYASAATTANNALSAIRTVTAYGGQRVEVEKYTVHLRKAEKAGFQKSFRQGLGMVRARPPLSPPCPFVYVPSTSYLLNSFRFLFAHRFPLSFSIPVFRSQSDASFCAHFIRVAEV